ncbi:MAG: hypothetical protein JW741_01885, partial [Sedimentisphaerales bacterium]|nr:hypothetical protein [Sedimentisphaerales bacterium]
MRLAVVGAIVLMLGSMAMAQTPFTIDYTIQMGGDNHEQDFKNEVYKAFTPGTTTPGTFVYNPLDPTSAILTWDVTAEASGSDIDDWVIQGIANLVFNVELQTEAGVPVAPA